MILIELTPKEAEMVEMLVSRYNLESRNKDVEEITEYENRVMKSQTILDKIKEAFKPKVEELITHQDLTYIISNAKDKYLELPHNLRISRKKIEENDLAKISLANSLIMWLNSRNLLKRLASFDITEHAYDFEDSND